MKTAEEIMTPQPITFKDTQDLAEVTAKFIEARVTSVPIVDVNHKAIGFLSESAVMRSLLLYASNPMKKLIIQDVKNLIDPPVFVQLKDPLDAVIKTMLASKTTRAIVLHPDKKIAGLISPKDILRHVFEELVQKKGINPSIKNAAAILSKSASSVSMPQSGPGQENVFQKFFEYSPYMMHSIDAGGTVRLANRKTHIELGYEFPELVGKSFKDLYLEKYWESAELGLKTAMKPGEFQTILTSMKHKDGPSIPVEISTSGLFDAKQNFQGTVSIVRHLEKDKSITSIMELIGLFEDRNQSREEHK